MNFKDSFKHIEETREHGKWFPLYGVDFKIAYFKNQSVIDFVRDSFKKTGITDVSKLPEDLLCELISNHLIKDWKGMIIEDKETKYTSKRALKLFNEKEDGEYIYKALLLKVLELSMIETNFNEVDEIIVKK